MIKFLWIKIFLKQKRPQYTLTTKLSTTETWPSNWKIVPGTQLRAEKSTHKRWKFLESKFKLWQLDLLALTYTSEKAGEAIFKREWLSFSEQKVTNLHFGKIFKHTCQIKVTVKITADTMNLKKEIENIFTSTRGKKQADQQEIEVRWISDVVSNIRIEDICV